MRRIQLTDDAGDRVEVANGDYRKVFKRAEQPFEVTDVEWPLLMQTGHFEEAKAVKMLPPPPQQQQNGGTENK